MSLRPEAELLMKIHVIVMKMFMKIACKDREAGRQLSRVSSKKPPQSPSYILPYSDLLDGSDGGNKLQ